MVDGQTLREVASIIRSTFKQPNLTITAETTADDVPGWDSLSHAVLLMNVERAFGVRFAAAQIFDLENVGALAELVNTILEEGKQGDANA